MGQASAMVLVLVDTVLALLQVDNIAVNVGLSRSLFHHLGQLLVNHHIHDHLQLSLFNLYIDPY